MVAGKRGPVRIYGEPNINSVKAVQYMTWHLNHQSRIAKETMAALPPEHLAVALANPPTPDVTSLNSRQSEYFPCGIYNPRNNNSSSFARTVGGGSWHASGGIRSMQRDGYGDPAAGLKAEAWRAYQASAPSVARRSASSPALDAKGSGGPVVGAGAAALGIPDFRRPQNASIAAQVQRALPYRSIASALRHEREGEEWEAAPQAMYRPEDPVATPLSRVSTATPVPLLDNGFGGMLGQDERRRPSNASIAAQVMRALPNRSTASVLRHGRGEEEQAG